MNRLFILIIAVPLIEIFLFIKVGSYIGAYNTISLTLITAIIGVIYARYEGFNTLRSAIPQLKKDEIPIYEIISGAALAFAALLLILPGFATDLIGFLLIFPPTRKVFVNKFSKNVKSKNNLNNNVIEGEFEDKEDWLWLEIIKY